MIWQQSYEKRVAAWQAMRSEIQTLPFEQMLQTCNNWWYTAPLYSRWLWYEDYSNWPNPWELLEENKICELSRALGMVYTLLLIDEQLVHQISIDYTGNEFIVNVENGKYILNWSDEKIVSITSLETNILRSIKATSIKKI
jgi:hypothetical protein